MEIERTKDRGLFLVKRLTSHARGFSVTRSVIALLSALILCSLPAHATLITVSASDYAIATETTHINDGVTIQSVRAARVGGTGGVPVVTYGSSYVTPLIIGFGLDTGLRAFASPTLFTHFAPMAWTSGAIINHFIDGGLDYNNSEALQFDFAEPTDYVRFIGGTTGDGGDIDELVVAAAFDDDWNLLFMCYSYGCNQKIDSYQNKSIFTLGIELAVDTPQISHVIAGGMFQGFISSVTWHNVPEPATVMLLLVGLLGLAVCRRKLTA